MLFNTICDRLRLEGKTVFCTASSGAAAQLLRKGTSVHYRFNIGVKEEVRYECLLHEDDMKEFLVLHSDVFIIDEVSMLYKKILENLDKKFRIITGKNLLFGGKKLFLPEIFDKFCRSLSIRLQLKLSITVFCVHICLKKM